MAVCHFKGVQMLENNKIHLGDAYQLIKLIPDNSVDLIVTDPPYLMKGVKPRQKIYSSMGKNIRSRDVELYEANIVDGFNLDILTEFVRVLKNINCYIWCNKAQIISYLDFFVKEHKCKFEILIWNKANPVPAYNHNYLTDKEYCLYFRKSSYCQPKNYTDAKTVFYEQTNIADKKLFKHPTIKPLKFIKQLICNSSNQGDLILDPFIGSGTTAIASIELNRQFIGFEHNKKWHTIATNRLKGTTATGQTSFLLR